MGRHSGFGFSSILLTFITISILSFSVLALLTSYSDYQMSQKAASNAGAYYTAETKAYHSLAEIDRALAVSYRDCPDKTSYYALIKETLPQLCDGDITETAEGYLFTFTEPMQDTQYLKVTLTIRYPTKPKQNFYEITEWKSITK